METILAIIFITSPTIYFGIRQYIEYEVSLKSLVKNTSQLSKLFTIIMLFYVMWAFTNEIKDIISISAISSLKLRIFLVAYIIPGFAYSLIIFPSTSSEVFGIYQLFAKFGEHKTLSQITGILLLLFSFIMVFYVFTEI